MSKVIIKYPYVIKTDARAQKIKQLQDMWDKGLLVLDGGCQITIRPDDDIMEVDYPEDPNSTENYTIKNIGCVSCANCKFYKEAISEYGNTFYRCKRPDIQQGPKAWINTKPTDFCSRYERRNVRKKNENS